MKYDVIIIGGGHAGCEAALASSRLNKKTLLITSNKANIADMPCNPSIGGPAKGIVVREIDALGGEMAKNIDKSILQLKMLNTKKGPAVRALRAQADKLMYRKHMLETLEKQENLEILEAMVEDLEIKNNKIKAVILENGEKIAGEIVILTTGTFLNASVLVGHTKTSSGPNGERASLNLSNKLKEIGFTIKRLKTGTPARLEKSTIDFSYGIKQSGDQVYRSFSHEEKYYYDLDKQLECYLIYTNEETHKIIKENLEESSMYGGLVEGLGPRYCPSIEDKIVRFIDKDRHQVFLEPESVHYDDIYLQGLSTSMPKEVQEKMIRSLAGLENVKINKYAYAIEYDAIDSRQLKANLESKDIKNLFFAGQINGTSGYEEAACQGLIAGINAVNKLNHQEPLVLKRNEAYIGVLIDDLITKGVIDPYRLLTSRAEHRLLLRHDNADLRLSEYGKECGLLSNEAYNKYKRKKTEIEKLIKELKEIKMVPGNESEEYLQSKGSALLLDGITVYNLLKRPEIELASLKKYLKNDYSDSVIDEVETKIKYDGYIKKAQKEVEKMINLENLKIPEDINYDKVQNIANEAKEKLKQIKPLSLGQASRISGINPSDITMLSLHIKRKRG